MDAKKDAKIVAALTLRNRMVQEWARHGIALRAELSDSIDSVEHFEMLGDPTHKTAAWERLADAVKAVETALPEGCV